MSFDPQKLELVQETVDVLREDPERKSLYFYEALFRRAPNYRSMFRDDVTGQGMKFMSTLTVIVDNLDDPAALEEKYGELGFGHAALGVTPAHFETMREAFIETLRHYLGKRFTSEVETAWRDAYDLIARQIMESGSR